MSTYHNLHLQFGMFVLTLGFSAIVNFRHSFLQTVMTRSCRWRQVSLWIRNFLILHSSLCCCTHWASYNICYNGALPLCVGRSLFIHPFIYLHSLNEMDRFHNSAHMLNLCCLLCRNQRHQHQLLGSAHPPGFVLQDVCRVRQIHRVSEEVSTPNKLVWHQDIEALVVPLWQEHNKGKLKKKRTSSVPVLRRFLIQWKK